MKTELWIIFAQDSMGHVTIAGSYEVENDSLPGLQQVLAACDPEALNSTRFFAARVQEGVDVSLHYINHLPTFDVAEPNSTNYVYCGGCRDHDENRGKHICQAKS